jgi:hypothetical protein
LCPSILDDISTALIAFERENLGFVMMYSQLFTNIVNDALKKNCLSICLTSLSRPRFQCGIIQVFGFGKKVSIENNIVLLNKIINNNWQYLLVR